MNISQQKINEINAMLKKTPEIVAGYLFGSQAKGTAISTSDIDIGLVCFDYKNIDVLSLSTTIAKLFLPEDADVTVLDLTSSPLLFKEILRGGVIYQKDVNERAILERRIVKLIDDYQVLAKIREHYLAQSFTKGTYANR